MTHRAISAEKKIDYSFHTKICIVINKANHLKIRLFFSFEHNSCDARNLLFIYEYLDLSDDQINVF